MQEKAALMDQAALEAALSTAQQDIQELEAENLLDEAKTILNRVAEEYPQTRSAQEAAFMLQRQNAGRPSMSGEASEIRFDVRPPQPTDGSFKAL
jgi:hypothetical protein